MADLEKQLLKVPTLPNTVQGDGRTLMTLLKSFLLETANQVNLANGFSAEEINPEVGGYPTPKNFFLSFTRLGGEFSWTHLSDVSELAYYELRLDDKIGEKQNLLDRTLDNFSYNMSNNYVDTIYLYAVSKNGTYSAPSILNYTKPRPDAPKDIAITKTSEGTLISFSEIPTNCIGAHIYIEGYQYSSSDNIFLLKSELAETIESIQVAFYDSFGDGELGILHLILPDITGLLVERNGSQLDFYWDAVNIYNVKYIVKVSDELSWEKGIELFRTATNDKNRYLYPNAGVYYIMVKAYDEYGNYSRNAVYQIMNNEPEIDKNIILTSNQQDALFAESKINVFYDPVLNGITLDREVLHGEYLFDVALPQKYRARNWLESTTTVFNTSNDVYWEDSTFVWGEANQPWGGIIGNTDGISSKQQIAMYRGLTDNDIFAVSLHSNLNTANNTKPSVAVNADDFRGSRWNNGLYINDLTKLEYKLSNYSSTFSMVFNLRITKVLPTTVLIVLYESTTQSYIRLEYDQYENKFILAGSDGVRIEVDCFVDWKLNTVDRPTWKESAYPWEKTRNTWATAANVGAISDWLTFGISQSETERSLFVYSYNKEQYLKGSKQAIPITTFQELYCYPKII